MRKSLQISVGAAISLPVAASAGTVLLGTIGGIVSPDISRPVSSQKADVAADAYRGVLSDAVIGGVKFKLYGVRHDRKFAEDNYEVIDDLVRKSSSVVLEDKPDTTDVASSGNAYFGTVISLCHKYGKPVLFMDPLSLVAWCIEEFVGGLAVATSVVQSFQVAAPVQTRREFLGNLGVLAAGLYFFSTTMPGGPLKFLLANGHSKFSGSEHALERAYMATEPYSFNHITDQRNVELTERLLSLPPKLSSAELSEGNYVLANFGVAHTVGIDWYLKHPVVRRAKAALYGISYGLIDSNDQSRFIPKGSGWEKVKL